MKRLVVLMMALLIVPALCTCFLFPVADPSDQPALKFDPTELPDAQVGISYDVEIAVSQNVTPVYEFWLPEGSLPPGLELVYVEHETTVRISGTPTQAGAFTFKLGAACLGTSINGQAGIQEYTLVVR